MAIQNFTCKETEKLWNGKRSRIASNVQSRALLKLEHIDIADCIDDLRTPPSNHLEQLKGDREGQHSIRINQQWRICFMYNNGNAYDVEIVDYQ